MPPQDGTNKPLHKKLLGGLKSLWKKAVGAISGSQPATFGDYIKIGAETWRLMPHQTSFSIMGRKAKILELLKALPDFAGIPDQSLSQLTTGIYRITVVKAEQVDWLMELLRRTNVVHHIYQVLEAPEEIALTDKILLTLRQDDDKTLEEIKKKYALSSAGRMGSAYVLQVTDASGANPLKIANQIAEREAKDVKSSTPQILLPIEPSEAAGVTLPELPALFEAHHLVKRQWNLNAGSPEILADPPPFGPTAGINLHKAWKLVDKRGVLRKSDVVIAVIDSGFDLEHPAFDPKKIDKTNMWDYADGDNNPGDDSKVHGTSVASIAVANAIGSANAHDDLMLGIAPGCTLLPIRIPLSSHIDPTVLLCALSLASRFADVVNCSFNAPPSVLNHLAGDPPDHHPFVEEVSKMIATGGRLGKGLVIVFSAGNHDAPIFLPADENKHGIRFSGSTIPPGQAVHSLYPEIPDVVVVGAMSSSKRKSGYSNWGEKLTVTAPSDNSPPLINQPGFVAEFPGQGIVAAVADSKECRGDFGGTSAAAPTVTGVVALMRSVNPDLRSTDIIRILQESADSEAFPEQKDKLLDLPNDPNLQGKDVGFVKVSPTFKHSIILGAGKVDAAAAVRMALPPGNND
ncbi:MAG TPA: S8 family serine peptidase [Blastocatellia bacterium]|nr:S8 family serine peptidase [Blastocatellia bacterium]